MNITQPEGNYFDKYKNNGRIINLIMSNFFKNLDYFLGLMKLDTVYEAGCGEGYISQHVYDYYAKKKKTIKVTASDISENVIHKAKIDFPNINFQIGSIYDLKEENNSFDLVIASEVLEHLEEPEKALNELFRVSNKYVLISVPNEPIWCISNLARGKYIRSLGNTPGHIKHWSRKGIIKLVMKYSEIVEAKSPFPWTMLLCEKK